MPYEIPINLYAKWDYYYSLRLANNENENPRKKFAITKRCRQMHLIHTTSNGRDEFLCSSQLSLLLTWNNSNNIKESDLISIESSLTDATKWWIDRQKITKISSRLLIAILNWMLHVCYIKNTRYSFYIWNAFMHSHELYVS